MSHFSQNSHNEWPNFCSPSLINNDVPNLYYKTYFLFIAYFILNGLAVFLKCFMSPRSNPTLLYTWRNGQKVILLRANVNNIGTIIIPQSAQKFFFKLKTLLTSSWKYSQQDNFLIEKFPLIGEGTIEWPKVSSCLGLNVAISSHFEFNPIPTEDLFEMAE